MKKLSRSLMALVLSLVVALSMCTFLTTESYAVTGTTVGTTKAPVMKSEQAIYNYGTVNVQNLNGSGELNTYYFTSTGTRYVTFNMPVKGTLAIMYVPDNYYFDLYNISNGTGAATYDSYMNENGVRYSLFNVSKAGTFTIPVRVNKSGYVFSACYIPASCTVGAPSGKFSKQYFLGAAGYNAVSTFTISAPGTGYLEIECNDDTSTYAIDIRTAGFSGYQRLQHNNHLKVGVKKGKYVFQIKGSSMYAVKAKFVPVKESSAKTSKKKAAALVKGKAQKGLIYTNAKQVRWYKIKQKKNQKLCFIFNANHMSYGNASSASGYVRLTCIFPGGKKRTATARPGTSGDFTITNGKLGTNKAKKGTYYIQVQSIGGANGYYAIKWK